ncbi:MAG: hypothetical protein KGI06_01415 [Candidatus Micrarchaeota archaeon]|nr:hypothetical protein [Candidatus Micrarchaeota archaeon]
MRRTSLCHICGKLAGNTCSLCGKGACDKDYDKKTGLCASCMHGRKI